MSSRRILGGIALLALVGAPTAVAQERQGPTEPKPAQVRIVIKGDQDGKVRVGRRITGIGYVRPFVPGQEVKVWVSRAAKVVDSRRVRIRQVGDKNQGKFSIRSSRLIRDGVYRVRARKDATAAQEGFFAESRGIGVTYPDLDPGETSNAVDLFNRLLADRAYYTANGRHYGSATQRAVLAFRKVNGMARTTNATPGIFRTLANGNGGFRLKWPNGGKHVEADLSRQVMVLARRGKAQHIFHISSGTPATPTVRGKFPVYRFDAGYNSKGMYYSVYFHGGYATHGYASVPTYPASHGCLRNPIPNSVFIYNWLDYGDVFYVYG